MKTRLERESQFHDEWALSVDVKKIDIRTAFEAPTALENQFILDQMGNLHGKRILDLGAGLGESSVYFALKGANVTVCDLSSQMVQVVGRLAKHHGVQVETVVSSIEDLKVQEDSFDFVYAANLLHHIQDRKVFFERIHATLNPGGRFFTWDPLAYNPVINIYRRMASEVRTDDERPLVIADLNLPKIFFEEVGHREFWILSLVLFLKYYLGDKVHPNQDRYWKRILTETPHSISWLKPFQLLDRFLTRVPLVRYLAWNTVLWGKKKLP